MDGSALRGAKRLAGQPCRSCGGLAVVFGSNAGWREICGDLASCSISTEQGLAGLGEPAAKRSGIGRITKVHRARHALRKGNMAARHSGTFGPGSESSSPRSPTTCRQEQKVECPLFPFILFRDLSEYHGLLTHGMYPLH
jgi:hypothetical protein